MFAQCGVQERERPEMAWCAKIRDRDGREGWTRQVDSFGNIDWCGASGAEQSTPRWLNANRGNAPPRQGEP